MVGVVAGQIVGAVDYSRSFYENQSKHSFK